MDDPRREFNRSLTNGGIILEICLASFVWLLMQHTMHALWFAILRSAQVRAYDDRALCWNIGFPDRESLCPVVIWPYLCSSDILGLRVWDRSRKPMTTVQIRGELGSRAKLGSASSTRVCSFAPLPYLTWPTTCGSRTGQNDPTSPRLPHTLLPFQKQSPDCYLTQVPLYYTI